MSSHNTEKIQESQRDGVYIAEKESGETLSVFVERFRRQRGIGDAVPLTYAGRLDPMASGAMLILAGEACKEKNTYIGCDKSYEFEVLFGVSTDTYDMLGVVQEVTEGAPDMNSLSVSIEQILAMTAFPYPPFSSKPVDGVPLFVHAKRGTLPSMMPTIQGRVKSLSIKEIHQVRLSDAVNQKKEIIKKVEGDFRQEEILTAWEKCVEHHGDMLCTLLSMEATVSSGVYIRTLCTLFGHPAIAYSIKRTAFLK